MGAREEQNPTCNPVQASWLNNVSLLIAASGEVSSVNKDGIIWREKETGLTP